MITDINELIIGNLYWLQFYKDQNKQKKERYLWLVKWGKEGKCGISICTYHDAEYQDDDYIRSQAVFSSSLQGNRHIFTIPETIDIEWYNFCKNISEKEKVPNKQKWLINRIPSEIILLIFN
jgi:alpha-amylase/alpha-mannosidase (GH57 family)